MTNRTKRTSDSSFAVPRRKYAVTVVCYTLIVLFTVISANPALAGGGEVENNRLNLSISIRFDATADQYGDLIEEGGELHQLFQRASELLYDATDGQHQLGTITVFNNFGGGRNVDIFLLDEPGRLSNATAREGGFLGIGRQGLGGSGRINLFLPNIRQNGVFADGAHIIAHELGHYVYGIYDEYCRFCGLPLLERTVDIENIDLTLNPESAQASLMENFWRRSISEFSIPDNHDPDGDTEQTRLRDESDWETIRRFFPDLVIPDPRPQDDPPTVPADDIEWIVIEPDTRFVLVIDRSLSMAGEPLNNAKIGASAFTYLADDGEKLGVASFGSSATLDYPLTEMNILSRAGAIVVINTLNAGGATAMGDGLRIALNEIVNEGPQASRQAIILLSDGFHNAGEHPDAVVPDLQDANIPVFTIALGSNVDETLMKRVASETDGDYFRTKTTFGLIIDFIRLALETGNGGTVASAPGLINQGEIQEFPVPIDVTADEAVFSIVWDGAANDLDLTLRMPDGTIVDSTVAASDPEIEFVQLDQTEFYKVTSPMAGEWTLITAAVATTGTAEYEVRALAESNVVEFIATTDQDEYTYPEPIIVQALPVFNVPVIETHVTGTVIRPDGTTLPIELFDDGDIELHGDSVANDGIYSNQFSSFNEDGTYTFELVVVNDTGKQVPGEGLFSFPVTGSLETPEPLPTDPFRREAQVSVIVSGVPKVIAVDIDIKPGSDTNPINIKSKGNIPVAILTTENFDATAVDPLSVRFGPNDATESHGRGHIEDVDGDGDLDLMLHFKTQETGIQCSDTSASLTGQTFGGQEIEGTDSITVVQC